MLVMVGTIGISIHWRRLLLRWARFGAPECLSCAWRRESESTATRRRGGTAGRRIARARVGWRS
ncbi:hypothetical protein KCP73_08515 [Salmonella enterica subsp. enterica]|nr:hypothetical protein KCP73_08515 [Salmonella enterica subsp. enterica]